MANDVLHTGRILTVNGILEVISEDEGGGGGDPTPPDLQAGQVYVVFPGGNYATYGGNYVIAEVS